MIASRRKEQIKSKRTSGRVSAADRSLGAGRAKRDAAVAARRGIRQSSGNAASGDAKAKPTAMEVEREVYRQSRQTAQTQARAMNRASRGRISADTRNTEAGRRGGGRRRAPASTTTAATGVALPNPRPPSKKAVNAAIAAMQQNGFQVPSNMQMLITFAPAGSTTVAAPNTTPSANTTTTTTPNTTTPRRGGRGRGRGGRGGAKTE